MQDLAGVGAGSEQRVVAALAGVAERSALLGPAVHLADERVDVDDQSPITRAGACRPRARERLAQDAVELTDVPERKRAQEGPERRRSDDLVAEQPTGPAGPQHVAVIDAVRAPSPRRAS